MLEVEDAQARIVAAVEPLEAEDVPLAKARARVLAEPIIAPISLPAFDNSAMDGYAVRAADVASATDSAPVPLRCLEAVPAGASPDTVVTPGACVRVFTGSPLPRGADAVVMQEDTRTSGSDVSVLDAAKPWENVRLAGEDVKRGANVAAAGERISIGQLALFASLGVNSVRVSQQPTVAVLGTGDELIEPGTPLTSGKIYDSNRITIANLIEGASGLPRVFPLVPDTLQDTQRAVSRAFSECDVVVTTGGVSVGEHDWVKAAFEALGGTIEFWRVAMKPGKPFVFGKLSGKFLFGLPGNPVSAFVTFLLLVRPALLRLQRASQLTLPTFPGVLGEPLQNRGGRRHFMRVRVDDEGRVWNAGVQASHAVASLARANGLLSVRPDTVLAAGAPVRVMTWAQ